MSMDITAYKTWAYNEGLMCFDTKDDVASFTLSSRLNDYWGTHELFNNNADEVIIENYTNIYVYNRETLLKLQEQNKTLNLGEDVDNFLNDCLNSNATKLYLKII